LSRCVIGASLNEIEEEEEAETEVDDESKVTLPVEGTYKIIGTLKNKANPKPAFVEEIIQVYNILYQLCTLAIVSVPYDTIWYYSLMSTALIS